MNASATALDRMRDLEVVDSELRLLAAVRRVRPGAGRKRCPP